VGTGILLALQYTSDINVSYYCVVNIVREVYYGWCIRYMHSSGASWIYVVMYIHLGRALYVSSYVFNTRLWLSGVLIFMLLMIIGFIGYVLTWGQMSFWGGIVITNLFNLIP
jgi:ubiquinol-cytochrome c reductase cytochrome b subunit|tara:strand:- start:3599 stop:3934 length:336 start_codon:yes stop_codon:yes gene_type:complete